MKAYCFVDKGENIDRFRNQVDKYLDGVSWEVVEKDLSIAPWEYYTADAKGISKRWIRAIIAGLNNTYYNTLDHVAFFVSSNNWENSDRDIWGWHLGSPIGGAEVTITKMRDDYHDTAIHEFMHTLDDYIYVHTGINLATVLGVEDFDKDVVHGRDPRYTEYNYEDVLKEIQPYFTQAAKKDLGEEKQSLLGIALTLARRLLVQYRKQQHEVVAKKTQPFTDEELLLGRTLWGEGRGEGEEGMRAIAWVVKNRVDHNWFPNTVKDVVLFPYQFSVWNPKTVPSYYSPDANYKATKNVTLDNETFNLACQIAREVLNEEGEDPTNGAVYYHTDGINPYWANKSKHAATIGRHIFYHA